MDHDMRKYIQNLPALHSVINIDRDERMRMYRRQKPLQTKAQERAARSLRPDVEVILA